MIFCERYVNMNKTVSFACRIPAAVNLELPGQWGKEMISLDNQKKSDRSEITNRVLSIVGIVLCVILIPILIINGTLLIKGAVNSDEVPSIGGMFPMIVLSDSMYPQIAEGDLIICKKVDPEQIKVDDVITFYDPESSQQSVVTHRVLEIKTDSTGNISFITKGDFNNTQDNLPIPADNLIGIYSGTRFAGAGNVAMFMQTTPGLIVCVALPIALLVAYDFTRRKLYEKQHSQDKDALLAELEELRKMKAEAQAKSEESSEREVTE